MCHNLKIQRKLKGIIQDKLEHIFLITIKLCYIAKDTLKSEILPIKN